MCIITRINISLPEETANMLKKITPKRGVSKFLVEAVEEKIEIEKKERALKKLLEAPTTFTNIKNSVNWIRKSRKLDEKRLKRLGL